MLKIIEEGSEMMHSNKSNLYLYLFTSEWAFFSFSPFIKC